MTRAECLAMFPHGSKSFLLKMCGPEPDSIQSHEGPLTGAVRESKLHDQIIAWCRSQYPMVPYIHARMDKCSTTGEGVPDFAVFYRGKAVLIECKARDGKLSEAQQKWAHLARLQGCEVYVVRSFEVFLEAMK